MSSLKYYAALAAVMTLSGAAQAADLLPPPPPPPAFVGSCLYLRGDVGVSHYEADGFRQNASAIPIGTTVAHYNEDFGSGAFAGIGLGCQFTSWFRADVTGEYRFSTGIRGFDKATYPGGFSNEMNQGSYWSTVGLVNGYFDLGSWYGFGFFVGVGVGFAYNNINSAYDTSYNTVFNGTPFPPTYAGGGSFRDNDRFNFAWALHAGVAYDVTPTVKLELAYRYLNLGDARTGVLDGYNGTTYAGVAARNLEAHDVKLGMRWLFGGPVGFAAPEPYAPLVRRN